MAGEPGVLQQRVEAQALDRRGVKPRERVRGENQERKEARADQALHRQHARAQLDRNGARPSSATVAPNNARISVHISIEPSWLPQVPAILYKQRLGGVRVGGHHLDREIRNRRSKRSGTRTQTPGTRTAPPRRCRQRPWRAHRRARRRPAAAPIARSRSSAPRSTQNVQARRSLRLLHLSGQLRPTVFAALKACSRYRGQWCQAVRHGAQGEPRAAA